MKPERAAEEAAAVRPTAAPPGPGSEAVAAATAARFARRGGAATPAGVRALHRTAGNAAVGRLLGRQPAVSPPARGDLVDPFGLTEEDWAQIERDAAKARIELREQALTPLDQRVPFGFLGRLRDLQPGQRGILHSIDASLRVRHGWDVLDVFNAKLRKPGEDPWTIELK